MLPKYFFHSNKPNQLEYWIAQKVLNLAKKGLQNQLCFMKLRTLFIKNSFCIKLYRENFVLVNSIQLEKASFSQDFLHFKLFWWTPYALLVTVLFNFFSFSIKRKIIVYILTNITFHKFNFLIPDIFPSLVNDL